MIRLTLTFIRQHCQTATFSGRKGGRCKQVWLYVQKVKIMFHFWSFVNCQFWSFEKFYKNFDLLVKIISIFCFSVLKFDHMTINFGKTESGTLSFTSHYSLFYRLTNLTQRDSINDFVYVKWIKNKTWN